VFEDLRALIRRYLYEPDADREAILAALPGDRGRSQVEDPVATVRACLAREHEGRVPGMYLDERFEMPHLRARYPDEHLNFLVPESYDPARPTGLLVLLHGGGSGTPREAGERWFEADTGVGGFGAVLAEMPYITAAPGNLQLPTHKRWSNPESNAYVLAVVEEASYRYAIDPDRVCIAGQSMGGFGAFHIVQTIGDRFATVGCHAGAWYWGFFEGLRGVDLHLMHGTQDAVLGVRPRFTDVAFARMASAILSGLHLPHTYVEHDGGHSFTDRVAYECFQGFLERVPEEMRAPFPAEIVTCSHKGAFRLYESPDWFWLTLGRTHYGSIEMDHLEPTEPRPSYSTTGFRHHTARIPAGTVHGRCDADNTISLQTRNMDELSVWLSREMVDFDRPVRVLVNGEIEHDGLVQPSLAVALDSYARRRDPGMLFEARIDLDIKRDDWELQKRFAPPVEPEQ